MSESLSGRVALVTGAAGGIGSAIAAALSAAGASVALADLEAPTAAAAACRGRTLVLAGDVTRANDAARLVAETAKGLGGLDILVNNAAIMVERPLLEVSVEEFERTVAVNLRGVFLMAREAIPAMRTAGRGGRVINIASELAFLGRAGNSVYAATKGGVVTFTRSWAREFAPDILVNAIAPGPVDTPMLGLAGMSPELRRLENSMPLGRVGRPEEIGPAVVWLAGPGSTYVTGQTIGVNGGAVMS
jgi:3-oxoacyl-[acyl-carrier protein] reductase